MRMRAYGGVRIGSVVAALLVAAAAALHGLAATAQGGTTVGVSPDMAYTEPNETVTVTIHVGDVESLYGADVRLAFDPDVVEVVDADGAIPGVQLEPLDDFLSPDWILLNSADNTAGTIQYAVTQVSPTQPVTGSGAIAEITFSGKIAGTSPITVTYRKIVRPDGTPITNTAVDGFIAVGPTVPVLSIAKQSASTARLSWTESYGAESYSLYRGTEGHFTIADPPYITTTALSYDDSDVLGNPAQNHFYAVKAVSEAGYKSAASNRVGEFDYAMVPGTSGGLRYYNLIGVPLEVPGVTSADTLAQYVGSGVYNVIRYVNASQSIEYWLPGLQLGTNFEVDVGGPHYLQLDSTAPVTLTFAGGVPDAGDVSFALTRPSPGLSCKYNYITIPFEKSGIATAEALAADIGGVYSVIKYDAEAQGIVYRLIGLVGPDFAVYAGHPYIVCLRPTAPAQWP